MVRMRTGAAVVAAAGLLVAGAAGGAAAGHKVTSAQIRNNTIKSKDIRNHTIRGKDIHAKAIGAGKLSAGVRAAMRTRAQVYQLPETDTPVAVNDYRAEIAGLAPGMYQIGYSVVALVGSDRPAVVCDVEMVTSDGTTAYYALASASPGASGSTFAVVSGSDVIDTRGASQVSVHCTPSDSSEVAVDSYSHEPSSFYAIPLDSLAKHTANLE